MIALTAIRDRDNEVYSVITYCWQGVMKGPQHQGWPQEMLSRGLQ
jgi:hypothetical protein